MKHLMTLMALVVAVTAGAQSNNSQGWSNYDFPFNPDANNDNAIGSEDLLQVLAVYGNEYGYEPPTCDYIASDMEEFFAGILTGTIVIDSLYWEIELTDITTNYYPGCPEQVLDTLVLVRNGMEYYSNNEYASSEWQTSVGFGNMDNHCIFYFQWHTISNAYKMIVGADWISQYQDLNWFAGAYDYSSTEWNYLPFTSIDMNEDGHIIVDWHNGLLKDFCTDYVFIPYWHYAD